MAQCFDMFAQMYMYVPTCAYVHMCTHTQTRRYKQAWPHLYCICESSDGNEELRAHCGLGSKVSRHQLAF